MEFSKYGYVCAGSIALGVFLIHENYKWLGGFFLGIGIVFVVGGLAALCSKYVPLVGHLVQYLARLKPAAGVLAWAGQWLFSGIAVFILVFGLWATPGGPSAREWIRDNMIYRDAAQTYETGRQRYLEFTVDSFRSAESYFQGALTRRPGYAKAHAALAETYSTWAVLARYRGEPWRPLAERALNHSLTAISLEPGLPESHRSLAATLIQMGQPTLALEEVNRALALRPEDREAKFWKWGAEGEQYDPIYFTTVENDASYDFAFALVRIGFSLMSNRRSEDARRFFRHAKLLADKNGTDIPLIYVGIGSTYVNDAGSPSNPAHGQLVEQAIREFEKAIELDDNLMIAHSNLGDAYMCERRWGEALSQFERALQINPKYQVALFNKAATQYELQDVQQATSAWKDTAGLLSAGASPRSRAFGKLAQALYSYHQGMTPQAIEAYREAVAAGHDDDPPMHLDSPGWCEERRVLGPRGLTVLHRLVALSGVTAH